VGTKDELPLSLVENSHSILLMWLGSERIQRELSDRWGQGRRRSFDLRFGRPKLILGGIALLNYCRVARAAGPER